MPQSHAECQDYEPALGHARLAPLIFSNTHLNELFLDGHSQLFVAVARVSTFLSNKVSESASALYVSNLWQQCSIDCACARVCFGVDYHSLRIKAV